MAVLAGSLETERTLATDLIHEHSSGPVPTVLGR
jgi:hypothetical protein